MTINNEPNLNPQPETAEKKIISENQVQPLENPNIGDLLINNALERQARAKITKGPALKSWLEEKIEDPNQK